MKKRILAMVMGLLVVVLAGCGSATTDQKTTNETVTTEATNKKANEYKVGIVQYVDDASLNQIVAAVQAQLDAKGKEFNVTFNYEDFTYNGQADSSTLNQIATGLIADQVDIIIPIATPTAMIMQAATEDNQIPVVFSAVSNPVGAGLVSSNEAPGANITGTSDALDTKAVFALIKAANPTIKKIGLLYDKSQDASKGSIEEAKIFCEANGIDVVEKTGTTNGEISLAADALVAEGVEAVFTPTDNTVMTAQLAIYEKFVDAKIPHYAGADSFALNGAFCGYGVNYEELGTVTADMVVDILMNNLDPANTPVQTLDHGIVTVNTQVAEAIGLDYQVFETLSEQVNEIVTAESFE